MRRSWLSLLSIGLLVMSSCTTPAPEPLPTEAPPAATQVVSVEATSIPVVEDPIYLAIIWHQHQPVYFKDPATGIYVKPWVRMHAIKDYVDMAAILEQYPDIHATYNLTPSLIRQLDDLQTGAKDLYQTTAEVAATDLTDEQKQFLLDRFFDTNREIIGRFPRYQELLDQRENGGAYDTQDYLDLQVLFNLAWVDPDWLAEEPLASLVAKGENFEEADKAILFAEHARLIAEVIPTHRALQDAGQIEVTTTPFAHPILPLLVDLNLVRVALPDAELPGQPFIYGQDATAQVARGVELYEDHFGRAPRGMWPAEGSVAQQIVTMVSANGIQWMASDEGVLANSLGLESFTRDSKEVVNEADQLYRPYYVQGGRGGPVAMVFRDIVISDKVGFTYSGVSGTAAARDFVDRIHAIRDKLKADGAQGPHLVSVILDGENAWEYYENDGKEFLHSLYQMLSDDPTIVTVTPSEFLSIAPDQPHIDDLWAGSWINHDFSTWIGEDEENRAWEYLASTRAMFQRYLVGQRQADPEAFAEATTQMYIAEGSDWFWWYGADQNSGDDGSFDQQFRETLKQVYVLLGEEPPKLLDVPIIPQQAVGADRTLQGLLAPEIDGVIAEGEWDAAGQYLASGGVMARDEPFFDSLAYGFDSKNLYLKVAWSPDVTLPSVAHLETYFSVPGGGGVNSFSRGGTLLGFAANRLIDLELENGQIAAIAVYQAEGDDEWSLLEDVEVAAALSDDQLEVGVPLTLLGNSDTGDRMTLRAILNEATDVAGSMAALDTDQIPGSGPAVVAVPDLGTTTILVDVVDPSNDDHGPGNYTYPTDAVFASGNFDVEDFQVGFDEENIVFRFSMRGPVENVWGSPNGLSVQTFDVYIDSDGDGVGGDAFLPGRNLALQDGLAWDYALTVEGWTSGIFTPGADGPQQIAAASEFFVLADPGQRKVTIRVPKSILGDDPQDWRYAALVMSQDGFPSSGVMRIRDVLPAAEQWRIGGAPAGSTNHTRVMDLVWPDAGEQETWLSDFAASNGPQSELSAADFARVAMFSAE